ncbi:MAG: bifunctional riboflavin kinase/FAD synthetase [Lachnospiraceae bacterium]|nr:bifunctional riboflavin kinase/FAD synthetase [Lachnospiraceae bacterium]
MEIITDLSKCELHMETAVAIGKFDGLHKGHRRLLQEILYKKKDGLKACVFTFDPSPAVFFGLADDKELMTKEEKRKALCDMGVDVLVEYPMNVKNAAVSPYNFVKELLAEGLHVKFIAAGRDVSFGDKGSGNAQLLEECSKELGYELKLIDKVMLEGTEISSSLVRKQVEAGNMEYVTNLLGEPYTVSGEVKHGRALGRKLGMPTMNLLPPNEKLLPPLGVYYSQVSYEGNLYPAISNVGYKPTVSQEKVLGVETYLYDFDKEIYGEDISVSLLAFKRPEMRFESVKELKEQMERDILDGKEYHFSK